MRKKSNRMGGLSLAERQNLEKAISQDQELLERVTGTPRGEGEWHMPVTEVVEMDTDAIMTRIERNKKALVELSPQPATGAERGRLEKRARELEDWMTPRMLSRAQMDYFPAKPGDTDATIKEANYKQAVEKASSADGENGRAFIQAAQEWKDIMRRLHPDDPDMPVIERIRPQGEFSSGRHF